MTTAQYVAQESNLPGLTQQRSNSPDIEAARSQMTAPGTHDIACITYTSGTTGPSKAVRVAMGPTSFDQPGHLPIRGSRALGRLLLHHVACPLRVQVDSRTTQPWLGGQVVIRPRLPSTLLAGRLRFGITTGMLVGSMADMLLRAPESPSGQYVAQEFVHGSARALAIEQFSERFGTRICTVYNSTEGGVAIRSGWNPTNPLTVGRVREGYPGFEVRLVDEHDFEVPDGTAGECIVRASVPWVMNAGYLNNDAATVAAWRNGWFHTGDALIRTPDGDYVFVDRLKDVIRRRGENISSFEVEADVLRNPDIARMRRCGSSGRQLPKTRSCCSP